MTEHFESLRQKRRAISSENVQDFGSGTAGEAKGRLWPLGGLAARASAKPTAFELDCLSGSAPAAALLGPTGASWRPLVSLLFGTPQQRKDAAQLFASLSHSDTVKW